MNPADVQISWIIAFGRGSFFPFHLRAPANPGLRIYDLEAAWEAANLKTI